MKLNIILITLVTALAASVHAQSEADAAVQSENRRPGAIVEQASNPATRKPWIPTLTRRLCW